MMGPVRFSRVPRDRPHAHQAADSRTWSLLPVASAKRKSVHTKFDDFDRATPSPDGSSDEFSLLLYHRILIQ